MDDFYCTRCGEFMKEGLYCNCELYQLRAELERKDKSLQAWKSAAKEWREVGLADRYYSNGKLLFIDR